MGPYDGLTRKGVVHDGQEPSLSETRIAPFVSVEREFRRHNTAIELESHKQKSKQLSKSELVEKLHEIECGTVEGGVKLQA